MNDATRANLRKIVQAEYRGADIEVEAEGDLFRIVRDGKILNKRGPLLKFANSDDLMDDQLLQTNRGIRAE